MSGSENGFDAFRNELKDAERRVAREIDPGMRAVVVAVLVFVLLIGMLLLPQAGDARGVDILAYNDKAQAIHAALPHRLFCWLVLVFGIGFSMLALLTRRWGVAWIAVAGTALACPLGMFAVWSRQTAPAGLPGPAIGLYITWIAVLLLTFHWIRVVWSRTAAQLADEEHRRAEAAAEQSRTLLESIDPDDDEGK